MLFVRARVRVGVRLIKKFVKELNKVIHQLKVVGKHLSRLVRNPRKSSQQLLLIHFRTSLTSPSSFSKNS